MEKINYSLEHKSTLFKPFERLSMGMNSFLRLFSLHRMKNVEINVDEEKITVEGPKTMMAGDLQLDIKREDFRGSSVNYKAYDLLVIILGVLVVFLGITGVILFIVWEHGGAEPFLGVGLLLLVLGIVIIILGCLKKTIITLRFVDKNSNSVRHLALKVRRNAQEYSKKAKEFTDKLWTK